MIVIAKCFAIYTLEVVVSDNIILSCNRNSYIRTINSLIGPGPRSIVNTADILELVIQYHIALSHDVDRTSCVFIVLEYKAFDFYIVTSEQIKYVSQLILSCSNGVFYTCIIVMPDLIFFPPRIGKPLCLYLRSNC